jgi:hypothetical protein
MRTLRDLFSLVFISISFFGCKEDPPLTIPPSIPDQSFLEEFDTLASSLAKGWRFINRSEPAGTGDWVQAYSNNSKPFTLINAVKPANVHGINFNGDMLPAYSPAGSKTGYITTSCYASASTSPEGGGVISNWVISPPVILQNGDKIVFYINSMDSVYTYDALSASRGNPPNLLKKVSLLNRLQVRINMHDESTNCGTAINPGLFDLILLDINSMYARNGFPYYNLHGWTRMEATVSGLEKPFRGRFAFRYFLEGGGPGSNEKGGVINLDRVEYLSIK